MKQAMSVNLLTQNTCSWFHYGATLEDSERRLRDHKVNGAFLVREQPDNKFRLVFRCAGAVSLSFLPRFGIKVLALGSFSFLIFTHQTAR